jgi:hypothetical protein
MFDKENNLDMLYIYNICLLMDMHDNDDMNNLNVSRPFLLVEHHLFWEDFLNNYFLIHRKKNLYRNSCLSCSGVPNVSRHNGHLTVFSPVDTWWSSHTFMHLTWTLLPQPRLRQSTTISISENCYKYYLTGSKW